MGKQNGHYDTTKNYAMFSLFTENRGVVLKGVKRRELRESMRQYGWLKSMPLMCVRRGGKLFVVDGQHRLAIAKELGIPVVYCIHEDLGIDVAKLNGMVVPWKMPDYADRYAALGNNDYLETLEFSRTHKLPLSVSVGILGNQATERNLLDKFRNGEFKITGRANADRIAKLYTQIGAFNPAIKTKFFIGALFAICNVKDLDDNRLVQGAARQPEALIKYGSRDAYLQMLEDIYNFGRRVKYPLKINAENAMRERNPAARSNGHAKAAPSK